MALSLSEYLQRDFTIEQLDSARVELADGDRLRYPRSPQLYFHYLLAGDARLQLDDDDAGSELRAGDFVLLLYGAGHSIAPAACHLGSTTQVTRGVSAGDEPPLLRPSSVPATLRMLSGSLRLTHVPRAAAVSRALPELLRCSGARNPLGDAAQIEAALGGAGAAMFAKMLVGLLLVQLMRQVHQDLLQAFPVQLGTREMVRMATVVRKIRAHPEHHWTVASLAFEVGCSRSSFAAKFQAYVGEGPIGFVARTRLTQALSLLRSHPDLPVCEIAGRVGYSAPSSFTRAFKSQFGYAPRVMAARTRQLPHHHSIQ